METLLYVLGFVIGALGTWFLLYFLKTRKTLRKQHELIMEFPLVLHALVKKIEELQNGEESKDSVEKKPCDCEMSNDAESTRQEPGNCKGDCEAK